MTDTSAKIYDETFEKTLQVDYESIEKTAIIKKFQGINIIPGRSEVNSVPSINNSQPEIQNTTPTSTQVVNPLPLSQNTAWIEPKNGYPHREAGRVDILNPDSTQSFIDPRFIHQPVNQEISELRVRQNKEWEEQKSEYPPPPLGGFNFKADGNKLKTPLTPKYQTPATSNPIPEKSNSFPREGKQNEHLPPPLGGFNLKIDGSKLKVPHLPTPKHQTSTTSNPIPGELNPFPLDPTPQAPFNIPFLFENPKSSYDCPFPISQSTSNKHQIPPLSNEKAIRRDIESSETESDAIETERKLPSLRNSMLDEANIPCPQVFTPQNLNKTPIQSSQGPKHLVQQPRIQNFDENTESYEDMGPSKMTQKQPPPYLEKPWKQISHLKVCGEFIEINQKDINSSKLPPPPIKEFKDEMPSNHVRNVVAEQTFETEDYDSEEADIVYNDSPRDLISQEQSPVITANIIENLSWLLNHRQMFLDGSYIKIYRKLCDLAGSVPEPMGSAFSALLSSFNCDRCRVKFYEGVTSCNHKLCKECSIEVLRRSTRGLILLTTYEEELYRTACPKCKTKLPEQDLKIILGDKYEIYDVERNNRQIEQEEKRIQEYKGSSTEFYIECFSCKKELKDDMCFDNDACNHQCKECLASSMRRGKTGCPQCKKAYPMEISCEKDICQGCKKQLYFIGNCLTKVCSGHLMCNRCINECYKAKKCKVCGIEADSNLLMEFERILFGRCTGPCQQKKMLDYFILKECCSADVCIECQANDNKACIKCRMPLGDWAKKQLQYVTSRMK